METASFAARRPAATALPPFSLPPPDISSSIPSTRSHPASASALHHPAASSSSNVVQSPQPHLLSSIVNPALNRVLTPSGATDGLSPLSSGANSSSSHSSQPGGGSVYYTHPLPGSWGSSSSGTASSYTYGTQSAHGAMVPPMYGGRPSQVYSPSLQQNGFGRSTSSPSTSEGLPAPTQYGHEGNYPTPLSVGGGSNPPTLPSQHGQQSSSLLGGPLGSSQPPTPVSQAPSADNYHRAPPTPSNYYPPSSTPQAPSYPSFAHPHPSPTAPSPTTSAPISRGLTSLTQGGIVPPLPYSRGGPASFYQGVPGPVLSNLGAPGSSMSLVPGIGGSMTLGGYSSGHSHVSHMQYGAHPPAQSQQDRPFRCDQCPQSFNRNHDLKRHKRIHLAVKPFPCKHCDKSFSRKDALKRHRLVKGCGTKDDGNDAGDSSPREKSDITSDGADESPKLLKREHEE